MQIRSERQEPGQPRIERREHGRYKATWWAEIELPTGRLTCTVFDLSPGGARLRVTRAIAEDEEVTLVIPPFGRFAAQVIWSGDACIGIRFASGEEERVARIINSRLNQAPR
jgi:hypothetical protein